MSGRKVCLLFAVLLPQWLKKACYRRLLGWKIGRGVRIGWSYLEAQHVVIGDNVRIGHFNIARGLGHLEVGEWTYIANFNHFFGAIAYGGPWTAILKIGSHVNFMSRHFVDVGGRVEIGNRCVIGGRDTHFWSHTRELRDGQPMLQPTSVLVGDEVYVGARSTLVSCQIPDGAVVGAGSVVTKSFPAEEHRLLIAGNPATIRKRYERNEPQVLQEEH